MNFNERLKEIRLSKKLTQQQLAEQVGLAKPTISCYEKGKREPNILMVKKIAKTLNVSLDYLVGLDNDPTPKKNISPINNGTEKYKTITDMLDTMNTTGIKKVEDYTTDLVDSGKYTREQPAREQIPRYHSPEQNKQTKIAYNGDEVDISSETDKEIAKQAAAFHNSNKLPNKK